MERVMGNKLISLLKEIEFTHPVDWCNNWGREMGIYGNENHGIPKGYDDDLDAFRHTFANALIVGFNPIDSWDIDKYIAALLGMLNEMGNSEHPCSYEMDTYNNRVGREIAPDYPQVKKWRENDQDVVEEIAKIVAKAVKSAQTINDLADSRLSRKCQEKYRKKQGAYIWRTQSDDNVRSSHTVRDGKMYQWDNPPEGGHPGEDYGCRCTAEPIKDNLQNDKSINKIMNR